MANNVLRSVWPEWEIDGKPLGRGQHNRETRNGTDNQLARHQEIVYSGSGYKHAESHNDKFFPEFTCFNHAKRVEKLAHSLFSLTLI